jgi:hypothetical protein
MPVMKNKQAGHEHHRSQAGEEIGCRAEARLISMAVNPKRFICQQELNLHFAFDNVKSNNPRPTGLTSFDTVGPLTANGVGGRGKPKC